MTLNELVALVGGEVLGSEKSDIPVTHVTEDSRRVVPGTVFFAVRGEHRDGHDFAMQAVESGAMAVVGDRDTIPEGLTAPYVRTLSVRAGLGRAAHALEGDPSRALVVVGITGTNGKSSSAVLLRHVLETAGFTAACFGTLGYAIGKETQSALHTTPFAEDLAALFRKTRDTGHSHVVMEVSSHALEQDRVAGIDFDVACFTNLTQDHLDYHADMDAYRRAKLKLFEQLEPPGRFAVVNLDDPNGRHFIDATRVPCITYGEQCDVRAETIDCGIKRTRFTAQTPWGTIPVEMGLLGRHNVANALGVIAAAGGLGVPLAIIEAAMKASPIVPGRFEHVDAGQPFQVIVDYAHTEDGLRNVLQAAQAICAGRVLAVFGCGGDRDKGKRPKMAIAAAELADYAYITSDNPRTEDPERILSDIESGMRQAGKRLHDDYEMIPDRAEAIAQAIGAARAGDVVLIAGKGHEDYQILGTERIHFDDREVARDVLQKRIEP